MAGSSFVKRALENRSEAAARKAKGVGRKVEKESFEDFNPWAVRDPKKNPLVNDAMPLQPPSGTPGTAGAPLPLPQDDVPTLAAPYVASPDHKAMIEKIFGHAASERSPQYPPAEQPVFGPADPKLTKELVPQRSIANRLPPKPSGSDRLPANERARPILENENLIGERLAQQMRDSPHADNPLPFYSTGSVIQGLTDKGGLSPEEALQFMHDWAGQGAATSPRTATPQNLRNAGYLLFRHASGDQLTALRQRMEQAQGVHGFPKTHNQQPFDKKGNPIKANLNRPGFAMMGMHTDLGEKFMNENVDPWNNPKPYTFRENWKGNMADVTADTHNIRATLDAFNQLNPGGLPRGWFKTDDAYQRYLAGDVFPSEGEIDVGAIEDGLKGQMINGRNAQTEYPIMQGPTKRAAEIIGISPAEAQERLWFDMGSRTGLQSPRMAIPDLLNSQIEKTAKVLGIHPEEVLKLFARHRIPLAANKPDLDMPGASAVG